MAYPIRMQYLGLTAGLHTRYTWLHISSVPYWLPRSDHGTFIHQPLLMVHAWTLGFAGQQVRSGLVFSVTCNQEVTLTRAAG